MAETFTYSHGLKGQVDSITTIAKWGEYDTKRDWDQLPVRGTLTASSAFK
ncbi:hypothetical protein [Streptomyces chartreusis]